MNIFETASRENILFNSGIGMITVSDMWRLPLISDNVTKPSLNNVAIRVNRELKEFLETQIESFVAPSSIVDAKTKRVLETQLEIVKHIIKIKQEEQKAHQDARDKADKKQLIMELIAKKQNEQLSNSSVEELEAMLNSL